MMLGFFHKGGAKVNMLMLRVCMVGVGGGERLWRTI